MTMKNLSKSLFLLLLPFVCSCTSDEEIQILSNVADEEITKMTAVLPDWNLGDGYSRTSITTGSYPTAPNPVWVTGDSIGIYPDEGDQLSFRIPQGGSNTCIFDGGGWAMKSSSSYTAYSPFQRSYYYKDKKSLPVSMLGQIQKGNDNANHLGAYDIQVAKGDKPEQGSLTFQFERKVALVRMELKAPKAATWTSVTLESDALFTAEAWMNLSLTTPTVNPKVQSNSIVLSFENIVTTSDDLDIIAYMMLLPVDLTNKNLSVSLTDSEGYIYKSKASITNNKTNFTANAARWITATDFVLYEKPDYSWYNSSSAYSYSIYTAGQFLAFAKLVNGDEDALTAIESSESSVKFSGKTIFLNKDISLAAYCGNGLGSWNPISGFEGIFNGNGHTISDLYCNHSGNMGLFSELSNATIKNLAVEGEIARTFDGTESNSLKIGGIASSASYSVFENCVSNVDITTSGSSSNSPRSCSVGGICGDASYSTFIACHSSSSILDNQGDRYSTYYLGGLVGYAISSYFVASTKLSGDVKEQNIQAYTYVGGIVGYIQSSDNTMLRACYSSVNVAARQPGLILGSIGSNAGTPNVSACYYSGEGYGMNGVTVYGIGTLYYGGSEKSYDYGTVRSVDLDAEIADMNEEINTWNSYTFSDKPCNYKYVNGTNGLELQSQN